MNLLLNIQNYLRHYGSATQPELSQQFQISPELVEMIGETLRSKKKIRFRKILPNCHMTSCTGTCCSNPSVAPNHRSPIRVYEWISS